MPPSPAPSPEERKRLYSLQDEIASRVVLVDRFSEEVVASYPSERGLQP